MNFKTPFRSAVCALALLAPFQVCQATVLAWTLSPSVTTLSGGATVSGSLTYDTSGGTVVQWDITVDAGGGPVHFSENDNYIDQPLSGFLFALHDDVDIQTSAHVLFLATNPAYSGNPLASSDAVIGPFAVTYDTNDSMQIGLVSLACVQQPEGPACAVPEPATVALLGLGLAGLGWRGRKR